LLTNIHLKFLTVLKVINVLLRPNRQKKMIESKKILILGAGLSASSLIRYLLNEAEKHNWLLQVVDQNLELVERKINGHPCGKAIAVNALDPHERRPLIGHADLVVSMLPARFHVEVARDCIDLRVDLITPSYISAEMRTLSQEAEEAGIVIMNEIGVDPGIDHMSAMKVIDEVKSRGGVMNSFKSFCGGLIAPESDNNPWHYKFTWNPRNVVLAGQGGAACFLQEGEYKYIPYNRLFSRIERFSISGFGEFDGYANRDSLSYRKTYSLEEIPTIYRGTLRRPNYCQAWHVFVELGMTDDSYAMTDVETMTPRSFVNAFLPFHPTWTVEEKFKQFLREDRIELFELFKSIGLFENDVVIGFRNATPAQLLEKILVKAWALETGDKDMLVMYHEFEYVIDGEKYKRTSSMVSIGEDEVYTAMSNTVGLPVAIAAKLILEGAITEKGVTLPINAKVYEPILEELETLGIKFEEQESKLN
jgi:saccharopine dehydrogenase-like NADP-dependent oxidoreductase